MRSLVTAAIAAIEAAAVALAGLAVVAIPALLLWAVVFDLAAEPATVVAAIGSVWLLAHWVPMGLELSPEAALGLGQAPEELSFALSLAPLGITLITVLLAARAGWRFGGRGGTGAAGVLGGALGFGGIVLAVVSIAPPETPWPVWLMMLVPAVSYGAVAGAAFAVRAARDGHPWLTTALRGLQRGFEYLGVGGAAAFPARAAQTVLLAVAAFAAVIGLAALALAAALVIGYPEIIGLTQNLQLDPLGSALLFLAQLALLPVAVVWTAAWLTGAGFSVGVGSSATPFETLLGPVPALPLLGAIPQGWGSLGALAPALLVLAGLGIGLLFARRPERRRARWAVALAIPIVAAALAGLAVTGICALASGSLGPERLSEAGVRPWQAGGLAAAELGIGLLLGTVAGKADYSRLRAALPDGVPGAELMNRWRDGRSPQPQGADAQETVPLDDAVHGIPDPAHDPQEQETVEIRPLDAQRWGSEDGATAELELGENAGPSTDPDPVAPEITAPATDVDEPEGVGSNEEPGPEGAGSHEESETEALLRAYAWDGDAQTTDGKGGDARRPGWHWSRGKD